MTGPRRALLLVLCALAAPALVAAPEAAAAGKPKPKAKAKVCKKGTVKVRLGKGKKTGCAKLRAAPLPAREADRGKVVIDRVLSPTWPALRDRRGRRLPSTAQVLRRIGHGASAKLRAQLKKGLALVAAKATRAHAADTLGGVSDGSQVGFDAQIDAGGYSVFAEFRVGTVDSVTGPKCPTAAGVLRLERESSTSVLIRILDKQNRLVHSTTYILKDSTRYTGQSADDAKFDTLDIDDKASMVMGTGGGGRIALNILFNVHRQAQYLMRSNAYNARANHADPGVLVTGVPRDVAEPLEVELSSKLSTDADKAFSDVVAQGVAKAHAVESTMLGGGCTHLVFDPPSPTARTYTKDSTGDFNGAIEPDAEPGARPQGIWTKGAESHLSVTPAGTTATAPRFTFRVTDDRASRGTVEFKVTSKAGASKGTYEVTIAPPGLRYRVTGIAYTDQLEADGLPPYLGCTASASQTNTTTLRPSGNDADGGISSPVPPPFGHGERVGLMTGFGRLLKTASFNGCQWNDTASARVPCHVMSAASEDIFIAVDISLPADGGPALVTWRSPRAPMVGDVPPVIGVCETGPIYGDALPDVPQIVPRATFTDPGTHTIAIDIPADVPGQSGVGTVHSNAHYALTFEQLPPG